MLQLTPQRKPVRLIETVFDLTYLGTVLLSAALLWAGAEMGSERWRFGLMALVLGVGDAIHLLPRIYALWDKRNKDHTALLGIGKWAASITMTVFYVLLWNIGMDHYAGVVDVQMTAVVYTLAALRIVLCLLPQNRWTQKDAPLNWAIWRNIPFFLLGLAVAALFAAGSLTRGGFPFLWVAVLVSFACYLPVVLFSARSPQVGMLMLPKSIAYAAIVLMGFTLSGV
ncbi:MAG: hypothetical protein RBT41_08180 [Clostridia bacterium]|jgi:hypothetical protein|nr:hypothetical protein [Clostridia bacterium]